MADPTDGEMMRAMDAWIAAFNAHDSQGLLALYDANAHITVGKRSNKPQRLQGYIAAIQNHPELTAEWAGEWSYNHNEAEHIGLMDRDVRVTETIRGKTTSRTIRFVMLFAHREGRWQILAHVIMEPIWPVPGES